jgi:sugar transferase (PEP-CTERM/EpsH1 system associated)
MAQYVEHLRNIPKVIDFVDVDSEKWVQYAQYSKFPVAPIYRSEGERLRKYEKLIAETFQHCFCVSEKEAEDFQRFVGPCPTISSVSNGVDHNFFKPSSEGYDSTSLVFTGAMDYFANVEAMLYFTREIYPQIHKEIPESTLYIVGSNPSKDILKLAEKYPNIIVTGHVDRVQPYVLKSAVFVAPMRIARGIQNKILEAMAMGVPVVTTSLGFEGIKAVPGNDLFVEDTPQRFAAQVLQLMQDEDLRKTIARNAQKVVEENYRWDKNLEKLEDILLEVVQ